MRKTTKKENNTVSDFELTENEINERIKEKVHVILSRQPKVEAKNESQKKLIRSIKDREITICSGPAGSGKTFISLAFALSLLWNKNNFYKKIYLIKSVTTLKGEEIGFLKGDLQEKIEPFMWSFVLNLEKVVDDKELKQLFDHDLVRPLPLAFIRGVTLDNCIIVIDECQNISIDNSQTLLTRIGKNSKMILLGDTNQIDMKNKEESSLDILLNMFESDNDIGAIRMNENDDNIRNPIITKIEKKYKEFFNSTITLENKLTINGKRK